MTSHQSADALGIRVVRIQIGDAKSRFITGILPIEVRDMTINAKDLADMRPLEGGREHETCPHSARFNATVAFLDGAIRIRKIVLVESLNRFIQ